jgi:hypothetical protein
MDVYSKIGKISNNLVLLCMYCRYVMLLAEPVSSRFNLLHSLYYSSLSLNICTTPMTSCPPHARVRAHIILIYWTDTDPNEVIKADWCRPLLLSGFIMESVNACGYLLLNGLGCIDQGLSVTSHMCRVVELEMYIYVTSCMSRFPAHIRG